jgi:CubicO group peptidase (beta-lactamase class C family)
MYEKANIEARESEITGDEMLKALGGIPLANQPGTFWEYAITVDVLGLLMERVAKKPLDRILQEMLFDPLGMKDTSFRLPPEKADRVAESLTSDPLAGDMRKSYAIHFSPGSKSYFRGGAGLIGTAEDYLKFAQMVVNGGELNGRRYLSKKTVEFMLSNHTAGMGGTTIATTGPGYGFGLGWGVRLDEGMGYAPGSRGDAMWAGAWGTSFWVDPAERVHEIVLRLSWCVVSKRALDDNGHRLLLREERLQCCSRLHDFGAQCLVSRAGTLGQAPECQVDPALADREPEGGA